jgi:aminodeoxychorismate synthase component I
MYISIVAFDEQGDDPQEQVENRLEEIKKKIAAVSQEKVASWRRNTSQNGSRKNEKELSIKAMIEKQDYIKKILKAKEYIFAGHIYEVCLTHRFETELSGNPFELYRELRRINPAPFASFLSFPEVKVISSSPERFLRIGNDGWVESRPIKGTRPRGRNQEEDVKLYQELVTSIKDRAENMMIVDLVRNDFGKVCRFNTVTVPELMIIEIYATLFQMVSTIVGRLERGFDSFDLIQACFPGGSMTGAPKIRAMQIIDELEPVKRGIYSGSIGYLDFSGNVDLSIVIRTIILKGKRAYFQVGGAIVADSDPEEEYQETLDKAWALMAALRNVSRRTI